MTWFKRSFFLLATIGLLTLGCADEATSADPMDPQDMMVIGDADPLVQNDAAVSPDEGVEPDVAFDEGFEPDAELDPDAEFEPELDAEIEPEPDAELEPEALCPTEMSVEGAVVEVCEISDTDCAFAHEPVDGEAMACDTVCEAAGLVCLESSATRMSGACPALGGFMVGCDVEVARGRCVCGAEPEPELEPELCPELVDFEDEHVDLCEETDDTCAFAFGPIEGSETLSCSDICSAQGRTCLSSAANRMSDTCPALGGFPIDCDVQTVRGRCVCDR